MTLSVMEPADKFRHELELWKTAEQSFIYRKNCFPSLGSVFWEAALRQRSSIPAPARRFGYLRRRAGRRHRRRRRRELNRLPPHSAVAVVPGIAPRWNTGSDCSALRCHSSFPTAGRCCLQFASAALPPFRYQSKLQKRVSYKRPMPFMRWTGGR